MLYEYLPDQFEVKKGTPTFGDTVELHCCDCKTQYNVPRNIAKKIIPLSGIIDIYQNYKDDYICEICAHNRRKKKFDEAWKACPYPFSINK